MKDFERSILVSIWFWRALKTLFWLPLAFAVVSALEILEIFGYAPTSRPSNKSS